MACLKIQVFGKGLIPRGYGLAPRKNPFPADYVLIGTILNTPGLSVKYINPETGVPADLTKSNIKKIWDKYSNYIPPVKTVTPPPVSTPVNTVSPEPAKVEEPVKNNSDELKPVIQEDEVKELDKVDVPASEDLKPITSDQDNTADKTQNNTNSNNNQKYNNPKNNNNNNNSKNNSNNNNNKNNH